jgi:hypothetical protein
MTNCGEAGWLSDRGGYRYDRIDSETGQTLVGDVTVFQRRWQQRTSRSKWHILRSGNRATQMALIRYYSASVMLS